MNTSDPSGIIALPASPEETSVASALGRALERLANQLFAGGAVAPDAHIAPAAPGVLVPAVPTAQAPVAPPMRGPSALAVGAGGASPSVMAPPPPGPVKQPPLAVAPIPKESDARVVPGMVSEMTGVPLSPLQAELSRPVDPQSATPYFLDIAGIPSAEPRAAALPAAPAGVVPAAGPVATGSWPVAEPSTASAPVGSPGLPSRPSAPASAPAAAAMVPTGAPASADPQAQAPYHFRPELVAEPRSPQPLIDGASIKKDFPILRERVHGRPLVWLDNAATTQKPQAVIDRLSYYYEHENSNVHRAAHTLAARATDAYEGARATVRRFLNAPSPQEIVFVRGTTEAINLVAKSWGDRYVGAGDEIVITWLEHHANIVPWQQLCSDKGACLRVAPVDDRGQVDLERFERLLGPRTRLVAFSQVSNALGTIVPAREMVEIAHRYGARVLVDGAQAVSHMPVDVQALDCDFYCFSGHKVFAPTGIGALYGKREVLSSMPPWQGGGNMISDVTFEKTTYHPPPQRFEAGTNSIADAAGLGAALDYVTGLGMENIARVEHYLLVYGTENLARVPGLRMIGTAPDKAGVLSFVIDGVRTEDIGAALDQEGIAVRAGHHCAQPILRRFGLESTVRASLAAYNTRDDLDALVAALLRLQTGRPNLRSAAL